MAGIGFRLEKYFHKDKTIIGRLRGIFLSIMISSGPWLTTILAIAGIMYLAEQNVRSPDLLLFKCIISYTYAASLILFGILEMPVTRFLADKFYMRDTSSFRSVFLKMIIILVISSLIIGHTAYYFLDRSFLFKTVCVLLFSSVMITWTCMIFLSSAKDYQRLAYSFVVGALSAIAFAYFVAHKFAVIGFIASFTLGQAVTAILLSICVFMETESKEFDSWEFVDYFKTMPILSAVGIAYYTGVWIDKFVFWAAPPPTGIHVESIFYTNLYYDTAMFLAYLTIIPSLAIFLVKVETNFFVFYTYFFRSIERKKSFTFLEKSIDDIGTSLRGAFGNMLEIQGLITFLVWYFSEPILNFLHLPPIMNITFRYGVIGAFLQVLFQIGNIILLYFEERRKVLFNCSLFFVSNFALSLLTVNADITWHGLGYLLACLITTVSTAIGLNRCFKRINFKTFMTQPFSQSSFAGEL